MKPAEVMGAGEIALAPPRDPIRASRQVRQKRLLGARAELGSRQAVHFRKHGPGLALLLTAAA